jgi:hypothetical protein
MNYPDDHFDLVASAFDKAERGMAWHELSDEERHALTAHMEVIA